MKILGQIEKTPQLLEMETLLRKKTGQPVIYQPLRGEGGEPDLTALYTYDPERGHIIELIVETSSEYTVAHELAHGLMWADGLVSAAFINRDDEQVTGRIQAAILHPAMSTYLLPFDCQAQHESFYQEKVAQLCEMKGEIALVEELMAWESMIRALEFVETALISPKSIERLGSAFSESAPRIWRNTTGWRETLLHSDFDSPLGCREATVLLIRKLDSYLAQEGVEYSLLDRLVVPWVFRDSEAHQPALSIFRLDTKKVEGSYQGFLRYLRDESVVVRLNLDGPEEVPVPLGEWGMKTASDLVVRLEGKTPWNSLGTFP